MIIRARLIWERKRGANFTGQQSAQLRVIEKYRQWSWTDELNLTLEREREIEVERERQNRISIRQQIEKMNEM